MLNIMPNTFRLLIIILIFSGISNYTSSQITDVCGTDTVILSITNYHYGTIHWEKAHTIGEWTSILNAHEFEYKFLPEENMYYRAVVKFPDCPPVFSQISYVQLPPVANAGIDRIVSGNEVRLSANREQGAYGQWKIIEGNDGNISQTNNPYALLQGSDTLYTLVWKLTNSCGQSSDTVQVRFRELIFKENIAIVDTTDLLLSSNAEIANGIYKISFTEPVPAIEESTVLIGMHNGGYLRIVDSFTADGNIYTMQTSQATLEDLIESGALDIAQVFDFETLSESEKKYGKYQSLSRMPTRAELISKSKYKTGQNYFYLINEEVEYMFPDTEVKVSKSDDNSTVISLDLPYPDLIDYSGIKLGISGSYEYRPNLVADIDYNYQGLHHLKFGSSNAVEEKKIGFFLSASAGAGIPKREFELFSVTKYYLVILGTIPVLVDVTLKFDGEFSAQTSGEIAFTHEVTEKNTSNAYIEYKDSNWGYVYNKSSQSSIDNNISVSGGLEQKFSIGPNLSFKVFKVLGPYLEYKFNEELSFCINSDLDWKAEIDLSSGFKLGAKATILGRELIEISRGWPRTIYKYTFPYKIDIFLGNNQMYNIGEALEFMPTVRVTGNRGTALPFAKVMFAPQNDGVVSDSIVIANAAGFAKVNWIPGDSIQSKLEAFVLDCDGKQINNSPVVFIANADTTDICAESSLYVSVNEQDSIISPIAHMGVPPYLYSTDGGENFSDTIPEIVYEYETLYTFTVMDEEECLAEINYMLPDPCENSDLSINILVTEDEITVEAVNGIPPYLYSTDGASYSDVPPEIIVESATTYNFYVKDDLECIATGVYTEPDLCEELGFGLDVLVFEDTVTIEAYGGTPPYTYSLDGENFEDYIPMVIVESPDAFEFTVKDEINCLISAFFDPCVEYGLNIRVETEGDTISVIAEEGFPPYMYSIDGQDYTEEAPEIIAQPGVEYLFTVMDSIGCTKDTNFDICDISDLSLNIVIIDEEIIAHADGGTPPYLYAINDTLNFSTNNSFFASSGYHTIYIKDDLGCVISQEALKIECMEDGIIIGNQCWMAENLNLEIGNSFCYDDNPAKCDVFGRLYDWQTAMIACPQGWHLPSFEEWNTLRNYLISNGFNAEWDDPMAEYFTDRSAKAMASQNYWTPTDCVEDCPCPGSEPYLNNSSGFNGLPGGFYSPQGYYGEEGRFAAWWTSASCYGVMYIEKGLCMTAVDDCWQEHAQRRYYVRCIQDY